jgi:Zn-finger nucleic acid-binding protein
VNCPVDNTALQMTERQGVEIDYCPKCRGVWLDRGELDKLIERAASWEASERRPTPSAYGQERDPAYSREYERPYRHDDDDDHHRRYPRKRRGFLGDLFDFD